MAQLEQVEEVLQKKRQISIWYQELLKDTPFTVHSEVNEVYHSYWMICILVPEAQKRDGIRELLLKAGIETRPVFYPIHMMPMYSHKYQKHKVAEDIGWRGINLPSYPALSYEQVKYVCNSLKHAFELI